MNIKKILILFAVVFVANSLIAQDYNEKLLVKYSDAELQEMRTADLQQYELLNFFVTEGFRIIDMPGKPIEYIELAKIDPVTKSVQYDYQITMADLENFNPLEYNCMFDGQRTLYYKVGNTGKLIIVEDYFRMKNKIENKKRVESLKR